MVPGDPKGDGERGVRLEREPHQARRPLRANSQRRSFNEVIHRFVVAFLRLCLALTWLVFAFLAQLESLRFEPRSHTDWFFWLLPSVALFWLSAKRLVDSRAPALVRILGVIYAIVGTVVFLWLLTLS